MKTPKEDKFFDQLHKLLSSKSTKESQKRFYLAAHYTLYFIAALDGAQSARDLAKDAISESTKTSKRRQKERK
jgi:hypothetical protein